MNFPRRSSLVRCYSRSMAGSSIPSCSELKAYSEGAIRNMMSRGVFRLGVHYTKPNGGRPVFHWSAVQVWARAEPERKHPRAG
jgi:hypothetical protein